VFVQFKEYRIIDWKLFVYQPQKSPGAPDILNYKVSQLSCKTNNFFGDHSKKIISSQSNWNKVNPAVHNYKYIIPNITIIPLAHVITKNAKPVVYY
jgi:hypothetical protein